MKKLFLIILLVCILSCTSCQLKQIADTNGNDDYSLNTLTDEDFVKGRNGIYMGSITSKKGDTTTISVQKMSGISNLKTIKPKGKTVKITVRLDIEEGNARLVLMRQKEIIYDFKLNEEDSYTISLSDSTYNLRLGGESAKIKLVYTVS